MTGRSSRAVRSTQKLLRDYYGAGPIKELGRLSRDPFHQLEFAMTMRYLKRYLPKRGLLLDAGGGPGRYTVELARAGYRVVLMDLIPEMLSIARREIKKAGLEPMVEEVLEGNIKDLSHFRDDTFDSVLCLGSPIGHLLDRKDRERAVSELVRVAKKRAPIFVSVIGRLGVLEGYLAGFPLNLEKWPEDAARIISTGDYLGGHGFAPVHFYDQGELERSLERHGVEILESVGLHGLATNHEAQFNRLFNGNKRWRKGWLMIHDATCTEPAVVAASGHMLVVGRKKSSRSAKRAPRASKH
jgi:SAM-dependent methyltransferase